MLFRKLKKVQTEEPQTELHELEKITPLSKLEISISTKVLEQYCLDGVKFKSFRISYSKISPVTLPLRIQEIWDLLIDPSNRFLIEMVKNRPDLGLKLSAQAYFHIKACMSTDAAKLTKSIFCELAKDLFFPNGILIPSSVQHLDYALIPVVKKFNLSQFDYKQLQILLSRLASMQFIMIDKAQDYTTYSNNRIIRLTDIGQDWLYEHLNSSQGAALLPKSKRLEQKKREDFFAAQRKAQSEAIKNLRQYE